MNKKIKRKLKNLLRLLLPVIIGYSPSVWFMLKYEQLVVFLYGYEYRSSPFADALRLALISVHIGFFLAVTGVAIAVWYWDEGVKQKTL